MTSRGHSDRVQFLFDSIDIYGDNEILILSFFSCKARCSNVIYFREELYELFDVVLDDVVSLFLCKRLDYVKTLLFR